MKKNAKIIISISLIFILVISFNIPALYADIGNGFDPNILPNKDENHVDDVDNIVNNVWNTVIIVLQIVSIGGIILAGIRYMFTSADKKAEVKKSLIILVIGMVLVFGTSTIVGFVTDVFNEVTAE